MADESLQAFRVCTKCGVTKPLTNEHFAKQKRGRAGLAAACKPCMNSTIKACMNSTIKAWKVANPEKLREQIEGYRERAKLNAARQRVREPERQRELKREWQARNLEQQRKRLRDWKRDHRDHVRQAERARYRADISHSRLLKRANQNRRRARQAALPSTLTSTEILDQLDIQSGHCWWCDQKLSDYHVDHVIPISKGGPNTAENIVIACPPCNLSKHDQIWIK